LFCSKPMHKYEWHEKLHLTRVPCHRLPQWPCPKWTPTAHSGEVRPGGMGAAGPVLMWRQNDYFEQYKFARNKFSIIEHYEKWKFLFTSVKHVWVTHFTNKLSALKLLVSTDAYRGMEIHAQTVCSKSLLREVQKYFSKSVLSLSPTVGSRPTCF
jgi:hypothetical protein